MKLCLLGASGFVGKHLSAALQAHGDQVVSASLRDPQAAARLAAPCDAIVNLAGEPISQRWSARVKRHIAESRIDAPKAFLAALAHLPHAVNVYVSASAIGYYGTSEDATFTEESPPGNDFLSRVCADWEREAMRARDLGMRVAVIRTGVVLGTDGGALAKILPPFRLGLGGPIGSGCQWFSWIHIDDLIGIYLAAVERGDGAFNATAPTPVTNATFAHTLGAALHRPAKITTPAFPLRAALGEGAKVLLEGQRVLPQRTQTELRYTFAYPTLEPALSTLTHPPSPA